MKLRKLDRVDWFLLAVVGAAVLYVASPTLGQALGFIKAKKFTTTTTDSETTLSDWHDDLTLSCWDVDTSGSEVADVCYSRTTGVWRIDPALALGDGTAQDVCVTFDLDTDQTLCWDESEDEFVFSDDARADSIRVGASLTDWTQSEDDGTTADLWEIVDTDAVESYSRVDRSTDTLETYIGASANAAYTKHARSDTTCNFGAGHQQESYSGATGTLTIGDSACANDTLSIDYQSVNQNAGSFNGVGGVYTATFTVEGALNLDTGNDDSDFVITLQRTSGNKTFKWDEAANEWQFDDHVKAEGLETEVLMDMGSVDSLSDGDTTPDVSGGAVFQTANTAGTTVTDFDSGVAGQIIYVIINDGNTTIDCTASGIKCNVGVDWSPIDGDHMECLYDGTDWYCDVSDNTA